MNAQHTNDCLFCKIVHGDIPARVVYQDDDTLAFLDIAPVREGHTLVIPKVHSTNIFDISEDSWLATMRTVRTLARAVRDAVGAKGVNIIVNNEPEAGQVIFHPHVHIIPRHDAGELPVWHGSAYGDDTVADELASKIRNAMNK